MGDHIVNGKFQSDKYPSCPPDKVPLSVNDKTAQDLLWEYAQRRRKVDAGFSEDLEVCLLKAGFVPLQPKGAAQEVHALVGAAAMEELGGDALDHETSLRIADRAVEKLAARLTAAFLAGVEYGMGWLDEAPEAAAEAKMYADRVLASESTPHPVLSAEEKGALRAIRRLVATTAKCCNQRQEYDIQLAVLDRLLLEPGSV